MIWIQSQEQYYFTGSVEDVRGKLTSGIEKEASYINTSFLQKSEFILEPTDKELRTLISIGNSFENTVVLSSGYPTSYSFGEYHPFTVIELLGENYPFTKEEVLLGISKEKILQEKLGLKIVKSTKNLDNMAGAEKLRDDVKNMLQLEYLGISSITGIFLFGVAGAGKTFFAECLAGETGRYFVELDLPYFMSLPSPTKAIDYMFEFLEKQEHKYLLLIDEIEKMFDFEGNNLAAKQVFGKLLTRLNNIYGDPNSNITFVATANNITGIVKNAPEFLRKGRFNRLYFLDYPTDENAEKIFELYKALGKKSLTGAFNAMYDRYKHGKYQPKEENMYSLMVPYLEKVSNGTYSLEELTEFFYLDFNVKRNIRFIDSKFGKHKVSDSNKFIYSPPEIQSVCEEMQNSALLNVLEKRLSPEVLDRTQGMEQYESNDTFIFEILQFIVPLQISAADGISAQISQSKSYISGAGDISQFTET